ncbi:hypothetical protein SDC9_179166 [bioreactor metagenome]|uniref:Uncharacterized protein n=1 Tax=bioreactor metagenome TaxID=1076179 RepID=A0A645H073_9ZZZZ
MDGIAAVDKRILHIIAAEQKHFPLQFKSIPDRTGTVAASPPRNGKRSGDASGALLQKCGRFWFELQLLPGCAGQNHPAVKTVCGKPGKRPRVVGMGMGQKQKFGTGNLLPGQVRIG